MKYSKEELEAVVDGYLKGLEFAEYVHGDDEDEPECFIKDCAYYFEKRSVKLIEKRVREFLKQVEREDFDEYLVHRTLQNFGSDVYFTTHGHGVGFWDGNCEKKLGNKLTEICNANREETYVTIYRRKLRID